MARHSWRSWACLVMLGPCLGWAGGPPTQFRFVQITDTHWGARDGVALTRRAAEAINALPFKIEFVVHTGDLLADAIGREAVVKEGLEALRAIHAPVYCVPGNHDILAEDPRTTAALYQRAIGPLSRRIDVQGVACLFFYDEPLASGLKVPGYDALAWLQDALKQAGNRPVLLFQHSPSVGALLGTRDAAWDSGARESWEAAVRQHPSIKAIVAGHVHRDELHWIGDIPLYASAPLSRFWDRQPSFRVYDYWNGKVGYWTVFLDESEASGGAAPVPDARPPKKVRPGKE